MENLFQINKHDLSIRPVYHWTPDRIRAHITICFLSHAALKSTERRLRDAGVDTTVEHLTETLRGVNIEA